MRKPERTQQTGTKFVLPINLSPVSVLYSRLLVFPTVLLDKLFNLLLDKQFNLPNTNNDSSQLPSSVSQVLILHAICD